MLRPVWRHGWLGGCASLALGGCAPAFNFTLVTSPPFAAVNSVALLMETERPTGPYVTVARFRGVERASCAPEERYCTLRARARKWGADAVWIQSVNVVSYPGEWKMIEGRLTQIRGFSTPVVEGILLRYGAADRPARKVEGW